MSTFYPYNFVVSFKLEMKEKLLFSWKKNRSVKCYDFQTLCQLKYIYCELYNLLDTFLSLHKTSDQATVKK